MPPHTPGPTADDPFSYALLDALACGVIVLGQLGELLFANRAVRLLLDLAETGARGRAWPEAAAAALRADGTPFAPADQPFALAFATRRPVRDVLLGFSRPGRRGQVWVKTSAEPLLAADGGVASVICTLEDVGAQRRREERLRDGELRYRQALERVQEVVWRSNRAGRLTYVNPAACRVLGRPAAALMGRPALDFVRADQRERVARTLSALARERSSSCYFEVLVGDGDARPVKLGLHVQVLFDGRRVRGFQGVAQDSGATPRAQASPASAAEVDESERPAGPHILVVDDNDVNLKVTVAMLENLGYSADVAINGLDALHACEHRAYDAVLMDCQMPHMDGFRATAFIREREGTRRHTPIIALTASVLPSERQKCLTAGMDDFLCKPVGLRQLDETLRRWTTRAEPEPAAAGRFVLAADHPLRALEVQGLGALVAEVFGTFLETTPTYVRQMHTAHAHSDAAQLVSLAHSLKGAAVQVGAEDLAEICTRLQAAARSEDLTGLAALLVALESTFEGLRRALEPQRQRLLQAALP